MIVLFAAAWAATTAELPAFMTGCWHIHDEQSWTEECWMEPKAGLMLGASREGQGTTLKNWEWMRIERDAAGGTTFFASPSGRPPTAFKLDRIGVDEVSFINPAHDFPQRVTYRMIAKQLEGEISLLDGSKAISWRYRREGEADGDGR